MRCFLGIPVPEELKKKIGKIIEKINVGGIKFVGPENLHWTVKFFGDIREGQVDRIKELMESVEGGDMEIEVRGVGTFPSSSYVKVIWIGVGRGKEEFTGFLKEIGSVFSGFGRKSEIVPHLTIGRVKFVRDREKLIGAVKNLEDVNLGSMKIDKLVLYESRLTPEGPVYGELKKVEW
ncbi:MAG: RNA 2',3'-cyclic phosphodiesterase [archaeon]|nr:MAG: RNA 2',3'-cyclic phosphodiesterase [archaeon]